MALAWSPGRPHSHGAAWPSTQGTVCVLWGEGASSGTPFPIPRGASVFPGPHLLSMLGISSLDPLTPWRNCPGPKPAAHLTGTHGRPWAYLCPTSVPGWDTELG